MKKVQDFSDNFFMFLNYQPTEYFFTKYSIYFFSSSDFGSIIFRLPQKYNYCILSSFKNIRLPLYHVKITCFISLCCVGFISLKDSLILYDSMFYQEKMLNKINNGYYLEMEIIWPLSSTSFIC